MYYKASYLTAAFGLWIFSHGLSAGQDPAPPTQAINFMHPSFENTTGINVGENTPALNSAAGLTNPTWTNLGLGSNGRGSVEISGISVQTYGSGRWSGGSESVTVDNDASQQVFRIYVDDFENANTYFNGDGIGASIHVTGIQQYLAGTGHTRYNLTVFFGSDTTGTTFRTTTVSEGVPAAPAANSIPNLRVLGRIFPVQPLGNGRYPIADIGNTAVGARGWGEMRDLAADSVVIHTPSGVAGRGSIAGIAITPVSSLPEEFVHTVTDGMRTVNVNLRRWSIRSGNFGVLVQGADGALTLQTAAQNGPERTYLGTVDGHPDAIAAALLRDNGEVYCRVIFGNGEEINTTVIRPGTHGPNPTMGIGRPNFYQAEERFWPTRLAPSGGAGSNAHAIEAGVDSTYQHFLASGGTVDGVRDAAEFSIACMGVVYLRDTSIFYRTGKIVVRAVADKDPYTAAGGGSYSNLVFSNQWGNVISAEVGNTHGIAVMVYERGRGGSAFIGGATSTTGGQYARVPSFERGDFTYFWLHEAGHNWAVGHWEGGGDYPDGVGNNGRQPEGNTIMSNGNFARFSSADVSRIVAHRDRNAGYLDVIGNFPMSIPPRANMDRAYHAPGRTVRIDVLDNDSDVNGHALALMAVDPLSRRGGTAVISPGTGPQGRDEILYTPPPHDDAWTKSPDDLFIYQIQDTSGQRAQGFVVVRPDLTSEALVAHWTFDEPDGNDLLDTSGMQRNGILFDNPARTEGYSGQALELNGINQYANFPAIDLFTNRLTVTGWVRRNGAQLDGATLFGTEWSTLRLNLNTSHELRATWSGHNSQRNINSSLVLPDGVWTFVALVISPERGAIHFRPTGQAGQWFEVSTGNFVPVQLSERFFIGSRTDGSNRFGGAIDDFRVFGRSLSNAEVESLAAGNGTPVASQPGSIGHFPADQSAELRWISAAGTTSHRLYLADDLDALRNAVPGSPADRGLVASPHNPGVLPAGVHYWRVDSIRDGVTVQGPVWMLRVGNRTPQFTQTVIHLPSVVQGEPLAGSIADYANDPDGDVLTFQRITPSNWLTIAPDGTLSGTAGPLQVGMNKFVVRSTDPSGANSEATVKLRVRGLADTVAFNFAQSGSTNSTGVNAGETTATLNSSAGLENPSWTNLTMPSGGVNLNGVHGGISYTIHGSNSWRSGSDSLSGTDASQQIFRSYLDHGDGGGSLIAGDGIGASIQLSGLADFLAANQADRYTITLFLTTDSSNSFFRGAEIREGSPQGIGTFTLLDLPILGSILRDDITLGDGRYPLPEVGAESEGTRGWGEFAGLTADSITITLPAHVSYHRTGRNSISGFAITPIPANVPPAFNTEFIDETGALEGISYSTSLAIHASDSNPGDPLRYQILSGPEWLALDETTGIASGIPGPSDGGDNVWTVQVTDLAGASGIATLRIAVTPDSGERTWDISASPGIQIGAGIWNQSNTNWTRFNGDNNQSWVNGLSAIFAGDLVPAQTEVTLSGELTANNLTRTGINAIRLIASTGNTLAVAVTVDVDSGSKLIFASSGSNQFSGSFAKIGGGLLELNGTNTGHNYRSVTLEEGTIGFWDGSGLQSEAVTLNGGSIGSLNNTGRFFDGNIMIGGDVGIGAVPGTGLSSGMMTFSSTGTIDLGGAMRTFTIGSTVNFNGIVSNGAITKDGQGTLTIANHSNTFTGPTTIQNGTLLVNGSVGDSLTTVAAGATLGGSGSIGGAVTVSGTLAPGNGAIGNLIIHNSLTLASGSSMQWEIDDWTGLAGLAFDKLTVDSLNIIATAASPITIRLTNLNVANFSEISTSFVLVETVSGITGFSAEKFVVDTSGLTLPEGVWSVQQSANNLLLVYTRTNTPPAFSTDPIIAVADEDSLYSANLIATDPDLNEALVFAKVSGPSWLAVDADGTVSGTPSNSDVGLNIFIVRVADSMGAEDTATLQVTVNNVNDSPVFTTDPIIGPGATQDVVFTGSLAGSATDVDAGDSLTYSKVSGPDWLSVASDGSLSGTPSNDDVGVNIFGIRVSDSIGAEDTATLQITVANVNDAPMAEAQVVTLEEGESRSITLTGTDPDGDELSYTIVTQPMNGILTGSGATLLYMPSANYYGPDSFTFAANDGSLASTPATVAIEVAPVSVTRHWDLNVNGGLQGGSGTWSTLATHPVWAGDATGSGRTYWRNKPSAGAFDSATFSSGTGRIAVSDQVFLKKLTVDTPTLSTIGGRTQMSYIIGGSGPLAFGSGPGEIALNSGTNSASLQIGANITGSAGLVIESSTNAPETGLSGWIYMAGDNTGLSGGITVRNGLISVAAQNNLGSHTQVITLQGNSGLFGPADYAGTGSTAFSGPSTLTLANPIQFAGQSHVLRVWGGRTLTFSGVISGSGGFGKTDSGTLELTAANTYTGATNVKAGTLRLSKPYLDNNSAVLISTSAVLNLTHSQEDVVASLTLGGNVMPPGVYSVANGQGRITGAGSLKVVSLVPPLLPPAAQDGYAQWLGAHFGEAASDPETAGETADPNGDGVANLLAYSMGIDPLAPPAPGATPAQRGRIELVKGNGSFHFDYQRDIRVSDVGLTLEDSASLGAASDWAPADVVEEILSEEGGIRTVRATYTPPPETTHRFFRFRASR